MTGMEHAIEQVARVIAEHVGFLDDLDSDPQSVQEVFLHPVALARALDRAGLLAPCDGLLGQRCHVEVKREIAMNLRKQFTWTDIRDGIDRSEGEEES